MLPDIAAAMNLPLAALVGAVAIKLVEALWARLKTNATVAKVEAVVQADVSKAKAAVVAEAIDWVTNVEAEVAAKAAADASIAAKQALAQKLVASVKATLPSAVALDPANPSILTPQ